MAAVIPARRFSSSPLDGDPDVTLSPSAYKRPRLASTPTSAPPATTSEAGLIGNAQKQPRKEYRVPEMFKKAHERGPREMGGAERTFLDETMEVDDAAAYEHSLLWFEGLVAKSHYPTRPHMRQLLSICFFPLLFKPPTRTSNFAKASSSSSTQPKSLLSPASDDPFALTHRKLRADALRVLEDVAATNGVEAVCRAIRGYGMPRPVAAGEAESEPITPPPSSKKDKGKGKNKRHDDGSDPEEDLLPEKGDEPIEASAKRIGRVDDLWDFLAGTTARKPRIRDRERPVMEGGWEVLDVLVRGWEAERDRKFDAAKAGDASPEPLSLMRYFKPSASTGLAREVSSKALDIVFWPFSDAALISSDLSDDEEDEDEDEESERAGAAKEGFEGEMGLVEKREIAVRLLSLIGDSATKGHLVPAATLSELVQRMKALPHANFASLIELLPLYCPSSSPFLPRLLASYIETQSHSLSATSPSNPSTSAIDPSTNLPLSPRKRALAAQGSFPSNGTAHSGSSLPIPTPSQASLNSQSSFWDVPELDSRDFRGLVSRLPIEVPVPVPAAAKAEGTGSGSGAKRPKASKSSSARAGAAVAESQRPVKGTLFAWLASASASAKQPKVSTGSFARAGAAAESHRLVKGTLIAWLVEQKQESSREDLEEALKGVREALGKVDEMVENARMRVEGA
ncbi:hypothetical protein JCM1840_002811 [Sporobolomyces johnsonii]